MSWNLNFPSICNYRHCPDTFIKCLTDVLLQEVSCKQEPINSKLSYDGFLNNINKVMSIDNYIPLFTEEYSRYHVSSSSPQTSPSDNGDVLPSAPTDSILPLTMKIIVSIWPPLYKTLLPWMYNFCLNFAQIASKNGSSIRVKIRTWRIKLLRTWETMPFQHI